MKPERLGVRVKGIVQGVGFRPFIYGLAKSLFLKGFVCNTGDGVSIEVEGSPECIAVFLERLRTKAPPLSHIRDISVEKLDFRGYDDFEITASSGNVRNTMISPDISVCEDCKRELFDQADYRYGYPFINCTNCGPRFTIIRDVPYDRPKTTMSGFSMCETCRRQYEDPLDRRYHAQPVSCPVCGPRLMLLGSDGRPAEAGNPAEASGRLLSEGAILAIKGLGGYHLACTALRGDIVSKLRRRKRRDEKPFALMARDMAEIRKFCEVDPDEEKLLSSPEKPIVLLRKKGESSLPEEIAPGSSHLGFMLPYTPLHLLLFGDAGRSAACPPVLVMTSGNRSSEPICYTDVSALRELGDIADRFLTNDREIYIRTDDSVTRVFRGGEYIIRRARGYVPAPVAVERTALPQETPSVLALGGELKNTFCLSKDNEFYLSHHIGDLENLETMQSFEEGIAHFEKLFDITPAVAAYDLHPEYLSTKYALSLPESTAKIPVQHHHAHIASCMADNGITGEVIGVAFDGTGYGLDGTIWGGEFFTGSYGGFKRAGRLAAVRLPGGEAAVREPWRMAASWLHHSDFDITDLANPVISGLVAGMPEETARERLKALRRMLETGFNSPLTSSMGRLFDAVSALTGIRNVNNYEAQAAMELENVAAGTLAAGGTEGRFSCPKTQTTVNKTPDRHNGMYEYGIDIADGIYVADMKNTITGIVSDRMSDVSAGDISLKFHGTVSDMVREVCVRLRRDTGLDRVALSGGVFQNMLLLSNCIDALEAERFKVFIHRRVPANDGGISLGQAVIAMAQYKKFC